MTLLVALFQKVSRAGGLQSRITLITHTKRTVGISTTARHEESVSGLDKLRGKGVRGQCHKHVSVSAWKRPLLQFRCWTVLFTG